MRILNNEKYKNKTPLFVASVEYNKDPTFNYRIKVRIPEIHTPNISTEQLPWAARLDNSFMGVGNEQDIYHSIPEVGTQVLVLAIENDLNSLVYLGSIYKRTTQTPTDEEYLSNYGIYRKDGQFIGVNKIKRLFQMLFDGDVEVDRVGNIRVNASKNINVHGASSDVNIDTVSNVTVPTSNLNTTETNITTGTMTIKGQTIIDGGMHSTNWDDGILLKDGTSSMKFQQTSIITKSNTIVLDGHVKVTTGASGVAAAGNTLLTFTDGILTGIS